MTINFKNNFIIFSVFFILTFNSFSQGGFKKYYYLPGSTDNTALEVIMAPNGNIILVGLRYDTLNSISFSRLTIAITDPQGNLLMTKNYGNYKF